MKTYGLVQHSFSISEDKYITWWLSIQKTNARQMDIFSNGWGQSNIQNIYVVNH